MTEPYNFTLPSKNLHIEINNFKLENSGECSFSINISYEQLNFTFQESEFNPKNFKKVLINENVSIYGAAWSLDFLFKDNNKEVVFKYDSHKDSFRTHKNDLTDYHNPSEFTGEYQLNLTAVINPDELEEFISEYNSLVDWIENKPLI